jgi:hypothetical protein
MLSIDSQIDNLTFTYRLKDNSLVKCAHSSGGGMDYTINFM